MTYTFDANANMAELLAEKGNIKTYKPGDIVTGIVVGIFKKQILVDLENNFTGIILGKEINDVMGTAKDLQLGQEVTVIVVNAENENGTLLLSLRKAGQLKAWDFYKEAFEAQKSIEIVPTGANKGGLLVDIAGIKAFLPVSQLSPEHYPRVDNANANYILEKLQELIGKTLRTRIISVNKEEGKLIFSERQAFSENRDTAMQSLKLGDIVNGKVTGIVKFGIFVSFNDLEGLVHISEIAWGHVKNPTDYTKVGDEIKIKVIGVDRDKISLSMKQLQADPWITAVEDYKIGATVKGVVNKVSEFGAFITIAADVNGLVHLSEIDHSLVTDPRKYFKEGEEIEAKVIDIDLKEHRIALSTKALKPKPESKIKKEEAEKAKSEKAKIEKEEAEANNKIEDKTEAETDNKTEAKAENKIEVKTDNKIENNETNENLNTTKKTKEIKLKKTENTLVQAETKKEKNKE